mmetsp:Transcript_91804/g.297035  ORF Transcript_91804/g.297035 Transcript_91804/m.297035 type:complete len:214 (-) Transcript_91804:302-943(-)
MLHQIQDRQIVDASAAGLLRRHGHGERVPPEKDEASGAGVHTKAPETVQKWRDDHVGGRVLHQDWPVQVPEQRPLVEQSRLALLANQGRGFVQVVFWIQSKATNSLPQAHPREDRVVYVRDVFRNLTDPFSEFVMPGVVQTPLGVQALQLQAFVLVEADKGLYSMVGVLLVGVPGDTGMPVQCLPDQIRASAVQCTYVQKGVVPEMNAHLFGR